MLALVLDATSIWRGMSSFGKWILMKAALLKTLLRCSSVCSHACEEVEERVAGFRSRSRTARPDCLPRVQNPRRLPQLISCFLTSSIDPPIATLVGSSARRQLCYVRHQTLGMLYLNGLPACFTCPSQLIAQKAWR